MDHSTAQQGLAGIPRQGGSPEAAGEHWLVARLHQERQAADRARLAALMAASAAAGPWTGGGHRTPTP